MSPPGVPPGARAGGRRSGPEIVADVAALADELDRQIRALPEQTVEAIRAVRREWSRRLRQASGRDVVALALALVGRHRWVAYELVYHHPQALAGVTAREVELLGQGLADWGAVDAFGCVLAGPAWRRGRLADEVVQGWAASRDRWWRRAALVSTVPLNLRSRGGTGDTSRTLDICARLVADRDDMVVKALSWALRALVVWDPAAVAGFLEEHGEVLAARVRREVRSKLATGRKHARRPADPAPARAD